MIVNFAAARRLFTPTHWAWATIFFATPQGDARDDESVKPPPQNIFALADEIRA